MNYATKCIFKNFTAHNRKKHRDGRHLGLRKENSDKTQKGESIPPLLQIRNGRNTENSHCVEYSKHRNFLSVLNWNKTSEALNSLQTSDALRLINLPTR